MLILRRIPGGWGVFNSVSDADPGTKVASFYPPFAWLRAVWFIVFH